MEQCLPSCPPVSGEVTERESRAPAGRDCKSKTASGQAAPLSAHPGLVSPQKGCSNTNTTATPHLGSRGTAAGTSPHPCRTHDTADYCVGWGSWVPLCWAGGKRCLRKTLSYTTGLTSCVFIVSFASQDLSGKLSVGLSCLG